MAKHKLEYIWLDGYQPEPNIRSKTKIVDASSTPSLSDIPDWSFDGSSTEQAEGSSSDCLLKPIKIVPDIQRKNASLVLCEVLAADGSVHPSNARGTFEDDPDLWLGFEQEYTFMDAEHGSPLGFPHGGYPAPQGLYYCSAGSAVTKGREIVEEALDAQLGAGIEITGINAEVMMGQWGISGVWQGRQGSL